MPKRKSNRRRFGYRRKKGQLGKSQRFERFHAWVERVGCATASLIVHPKYIRWLNGRYVPDVDYERGQFYCDVEAIIDEHMFPDDKNKLVRVYTLTCADTCEWRVHYSIRGYTAEQCEMEQTRVEEHDEGTLPWCLAWDWDCVTVSMSATAFNESFEADFTLQSGLERAYEQGGLWRLHSEKSAPWLVG